MRNGDSAEAPNFVSSMSPWLVRESGLENYPANYQIQLLFQKSATEAFLKKGQCWSGGCMFLFWILTAPTTLL